MGRPSYTATTEDGACYCHEYTDGSRYCSEKCEVEDDARGAA